MDNANLWHLRNHIFEDLSHEDVLNCRRVCKYWNESLRRISDVKFIQEFGERNLRYIPVKLSTIIPGWKNTAQKYGKQTSMEDLEEVKDSLKKLARGKGKYCYCPVYDAARNGNVKLMEFIIRTSYDMNTKKLGNTRKTAWHLACFYGKTEAAQLIIQYSKDFGIELNARDDDGRTAFQVACINGQTETAQLIIQSSKEFGIDLNAKDNWERTAWHLASNCGRTKTAQLIMQNSKDFDIALNAKDDEGNTALHWVCRLAKTETVRIILKNWKEFGIDIKVQNNKGETALDLINHRDGDEFNQIKKMLKKEYSQISITESVQNLNVE